MIGSSSRIFMGTNSSIFNGLPDWNGEIVVVTTMISYTDVVENADSGTLIVVNGGMVGEFPQVDVPDKVLYLRGINNASLSNIGSNQHINITTGSFIIENITISLEYSWRSCVVASGDSTGVVNRCSLIAGTSMYPLGGFGNDNSGDGIVVKNCLLSRGYAHLVNLNLDYIRLQKVQLNVPLSTFQCTGTLSESDCVTISTNGYGPDYGDFFVSDSFLRSHGII